MLGSAVAEICTGDLELKSIIPRPGFATVQCSENGRRRGANLVAVRHACTHSPRLDAARRGSTTLSRRDSLRTERIAAGASRKKMFAYRDTVALPHNNQNHITPTTNSLRRLDGPREAPRSQRAQDAWW